MRTLLALVASAALSLAVVPAHADPITSVVVFGDSLSDNGNVLAATHGLFPPFPYVGGRFSNGPVAVEQLAGTLNVPLLDFAYGGATSGSANVLNGSYGLSGLPGMAQEIQYSGLSASQLSSALTVVWGGANDFDALSNPTSAQATTAALAAASNILGYVTTLQGEGARNILVPNLPNLGAVPRYLGDGESAEAALYSSTFNTALQSGLPSGATLFDTNAVFNTILADTTTFSNGVTPCLTNLAAYPNCNGYIFFDDLHPTTAADTILAQNFAAAVTPAAATPEPSSLFLLATGVTASVGALRRRRSAL
ncbi:SGNH/GDSL hydrolase family protein [Terriglobus aquaticus]|uniref:SGNH/GDSL hydrolase family protein n=1 Tax=Terriglobus aquaticus TaxID=940139 RepID=A0ABW9KLT8_9BACT|nr:SGNH/GDSL hydrolase family protein [Terriglobus aquaticus]